LIKPISAVLRNRISGGDSMAKPKRVNNGPIKCTRCGGEEIRRAQMTMYGRLGFMGPDYRFDVYICKDCSYSELFFQGAKWIV
jgi:predicted nucleic-acid-binding Zn-ribbon protein